MAEDQPKPRETYKPPPPPPPKPGAYVPTEADRLLVQSMVAYGLAIEVIATRLGVSKRTVHRHYREDVKTGLVRGIIVQYANLRGAASANTRGAVRAAEILLNRFEYRAGTLPGQAAAGGVDNNPQSTKPTLLRVTEKTDMPSDPVL